MYLEFTEEQRSLQRQLREYFQDLVEDVEGSTEDQPSYIRYIRRMGQDGWLGIGWPVEYGGQARGPIDQMIFVEESHWAGVPLPLLTLNSVGPTLMALGTDEQKQRLLPGILRGEVHFSIGYTEPSAGTDLASLKTRAVHDGDEYVINGQKVFTDAIQYADYIWLATRTDPDAPKHKGLSVFIVPVDAPGFHWTPLATIVGDITSSTFYEDVRVPVENLVGTENQGWKLITNQLNHERVAICPASGLLRSLAEVRLWAQEHRMPDGRKVIDREWVQILLARAHAKVEVLKLFNWKVAWASDKGLNPADASATKVYGTELALEVYRLLLNVVGQAGYLTEGSPAAVLRGRLEHQARSQTIFTFGGGTNEVQRDIIAMIGLGMPRFAALKSGFPLEIEERSSSLAPVFERFTDRARRVLTFAQEEARLLNHSFIGTEHILLGLLREGDGLGAEALRELGISLESVREEVESIVGTAGTAPTGSPPFTPRAKKVLELSLREALQMNHSYIGTEHILLGLVREGEGVAATVLVNLGAGLGRVRQEVIKIMAGGQEIPSSAIGTNEPEASDEQTPTREPCCPRCRGKVSEAARFRRMVVPSDDGTTEPMPVVVVYCVHCGTTLHVFDADGAS